jgi:excisionase family DNA binding protein
MNPITPDSLWTVADVARFLKASTSWVYKAASRNALPCVRIGAMLRFDSAAIRRFVEQPSTDAPVIPMTPSESQRD